MNLYSFLFIGLIEIIFVMFSLLTRRLNKSREELVKKEIESYSKTFNETMVKNINDPKEKPVSKQRDVNLDPIQKRLRSKFQTKVKVDDKAITIRYVDTQDLNRILELLDCLEEEL